MKLHAPSTAVMLNGLKGSHVDDGPAASWSYFVLRHHLASSRLAALSSDNYCYYHYQHHYNYYYQMLLLPRRKVRLETCCR